MMPTTSITDCELNCKCTKTGKARPGGGLGNMASEGPEPSNVHKTMMGTRLLDSHGGY